VATSKKGKKKKSSKRSVSFDALDDDDEVGSEQFLTLRPWMAACSSW
jgi:hypothetical protein